MSYTHTLHNIEQSAAGVAEEWRAVARGYKHEIDRAKQRADYREVRRLRRVVSDCSGEARRAERQRRQARELRGGLR